MPRLKTKLAEHRAHFVALAALVQVLSTVSRSRGGSHDEPGTLHQHPTNGLPVTDSDSPRFPVTDSDGGDTWGDRAARAARAVEQTTRAKIWRALNPKGSDESNVTTPPARGATPSGREIKSPTSGRGADLSVADRTRTGLLALAVAVSAGTDIGLTPQHLKETPRLGYSFIVAAVLGIAIAVALVSRPGDRRIAALAGLFCLGEILAWVLFVTIGVPFLAVEAVGWAVALAVLGSAEASSRTLAGQTITAGALNSDGAWAWARSSPAARAARAYFAEDGRRTIQTVLGLIWLLDGGLQFQSFMYSNGFVQMMLNNATAQGQPAWLASTVGWGAHLAQDNLTMFNTLFALTQVLIGLGLLYRPTVKPALTASFAWSLVVWLFGEGLGLLFTNAANPLTGAPGAILLYVIIGLMVWPGERVGGLLGVRGARMAWAILWLAMGWLWLLAPNSRASATHDMISAAPSGASWLTSVQHAAADATNGGGLAIALILASLSAVIGVAVAINWRANTFLKLAIVLNLAYWVVGQGLGGVLTGSGTDPNAGPLFILLALAMYPLIGADTPMRARPTGVAPPGQAAVTD